MWVVKNLIGDKATWYTEKEYNELKVINEYYEKFLYDVESIVTCKSLKDDTAVEILDLIENLADKLEELEDINNED